MALMCSLPTSPRYLGITRPLTYPVRQNGKCMAKMILSVWLLSASITLPPLFGWAQNVNDGKVCLISQDFGYTIYSTAVAFYIPMSVMPCTTRFTKPPGRAPAKHKFPWLPLARGARQRHLPQWHGEAQKEVEECAKPFEALKHLKEKTSPSLRGKQKAATTLGIIAGALPCAGCHFSSSRPPGPLHLRHASLQLHPAVGGEDMSVAGLCKLSHQPFIYAFFNRDLRDHLPQPAPVPVLEHQPETLAAGMHEVSKLMERPERPELVP